MLRFFTDQIQIRHEDYPAEYFSSSNSNNKYNQESMLFIVTKSRNFGSQVQVMDSEFIRDLLQFLLQSLDAEHRNTQKSTKNNPGDIKITDTNQMT